MLEIIAMISLGRTIKNIVLEKGLRPTRYIINMVLLWISMEIVGLYIGMQLFPNPFGAYLLAIAGAAFGGYLGYRGAVNAQPEIIE
ncbi:MAG: hypothetical protein ABJG41_07455 [Cyclobacteriaceae bacterium]